MANLVHLINYVAYALVEGDWYNDWVTHLPGWMADLVITLVTLAQPNI